MTKHLSQEQIDGWVIGDRPDEVVSHLNSCQVCAGQVSRVSESLTLFGSAVRSWGQLQMGAPQAPDLRPPAFAWGRIGLAFAALSLAIAMPVVHRHPASQLTAGAAPAVDDERLLEQIQTEISQSVPSTMEPIAKLMPKDLSR